MHTRAAKLDDRPELFPGFRRRLRTTSFEIRQRSQAEAIFSRLDGHPRLKAVVVRAWLMLISLVFALTAKAGS